MPSTTEDLGLNSAPRYRHNCNNCVFLGHQDNFDLYVCLSARESTVMARWDVDGSYASGMCFSFGANAHLTVARRRAQARGLLRYPLEEGVARTAPDASQDLRQELKEALLQSPVARAMQAWATNPSEARRQLTALSEATALGYLAQFPDMDLPKLRGWVHEHFEHIRVQLEAFKLSAPSFFETYGAIHAAGESQAATSAAA